METHHTHRDRSFVATSVPTPRRPDPEPDCSSCPCIQMAAPIERGEGRVLDGQALVCRCLVQVLPGNDVNEGGRL